MSKHANHFLMSWSTFGMPIRLDTMLVDLFFASLAFFLLISLIGHPVPDPKADVIPEREGPRKNLLAPYPRTVYQERWLRGAWPTDRNGVVQFTSMSRCLCRYPL